MHILDVIEVGVSGRARVELCEGDLATLPPDADVDLLVVSAFPDDYTPTYSSLIGALDRRGLSVGELAGHMAVDLRSAFGCWLSEDLAGHPTAVPFSRVLCFEPRRRGSPPEVVGDIFRALAPFLAGPPPIRVVAMPLVAAGAQGYSVKDILSPLVEAAIHWLRAGMPVSVLKIFVRTPDEVTMAVREFKTIKRRHASELEPTSSAATLDVFVSYSHENRDAADTLHRRLATAGLSVFLDRVSLSVGSAWQQRLYQAIDDCRCVAAIFSPDYLASKACQEEFNIGLYRGRQLGRDVVFPFYWRTAALPSYMALIQFVDCREASHSRLEAATDELVSRCAR